jgi:membrane-associated phospholipid phosphatase
VGDRMKSGGRAEDTLVAHIVGKGSRKGSSLFGRAGDIIQRPPAWAGVAALLSATGERGRRAALRGGVCYLSAAAVHLPIKALVGRRHPPGAARHQLGPMTSSFPSGHAASDLAFTIGAAQELPLAFLPLSACTMAVHWSLVRKRAHYPSDVLAGGVLGIAVALGAWKLWPPRHSYKVDPPRVPSGADHGGADGRHGSDASSNGADEPLAAVRSGTGLR